MWQLNGAQKAATTLVDGLLTVAADESASTLTVKATSEQDDDFFATAIVTLTGGTGGNTQKEANILEFSFTGIVGVATIDNSKHTVAAIAACEINLASITPAFKLSDGATATVDGKPQTGEQTALNFAEPVTCKVTSADGKTILDWTVTIKHPDDCPTAKKYITYNKPVTAYYIEYNGGAIDANIMDIGYGFQESSDVIEAYENQKYSFVKWIDWMDTAG
jgi:hypothetical protein